MFPMRSSFLLLLTFLFVGSVSFFAAVFLDRPVFLPRVPSQNASESIGLPASHYPWSRYADALKGRDLFSPFQSVPEVSLFPEPSLRVLGVLLGRRDSAALEKSGETVFFMAEGESRNGIRVCEISEEGVLIEMNGQAFILDMKGLI